MTMPFPPISTGRAPRPGRAALGLSIGLSLALPLALAAAPALPAGAASRSQLHKKTHHKTKPRHKTPVRPSGSGTKLPKELTSSTGNFFTLEAYVAPSTTAPMANVLIKVCTSPNTPADTAIEPSFFTLATSGTPAIPESPSTKSPQLTPMPLRPSQCDSGWMAFADPGATKVLSLTYNYGKKLVWTLS